MVCLGNICRSPLADGLLREKVSKKELNHIIDSAGTCDNHIGQSPDARMTKTAKSYGTDISNLKARQFSQSDFDDFDLIYVMDQSNMKNVISLARDQNDIAKVKLILNETHPEQNLEVPDPYFGGEQGFIDVYSMLNEATDQIIKNIEGK
ncbi:MAG TPA: low molecular weight phosphotyrosine protein phosphatase [Crocinitomicaceae bacterium]|nr:low molecular weight phosphotyrosine protein phosphatase [Crocinitomicaceae bacterium]